MRRTDVLLGTLDLLVLKVLSCRPKLHGYALIAAIEEVSEAVLRVEEGSLYPALRRMEEMGWVEAEWVVKETGRRARIHEITAAGRQQLASEESRWESISGAVNRVLKME
jgi:transcriptional regulator